MYFSNKRFPIKTKGKLGKYNDYFYEEWYKSLTISCGIPKEIESMVPKAVSIISTEDCPKKAHNSLRVIYEKPNKTRESFAVCHKHLRHSDYDLSLRLIEWLKLLIILGVSKVFFQKQSVHKNMERVLNYYQNTVIIVKLLKVLNQ